MAPPRDGRSVCTRELSTTRKLTPVCAVFCLIRRPEAVQSVPVRTNTVSPAQPSPAQAVRAAYEPHTSRMPGVALLLPCRASPAARSATEENGAGCIHTTACVALLAARKKKKKNRDKSQVMEKNRYKKDYNEIYRELWSKFSPPPPTAATAPTTCMP
ncbi:hypothetical protein LX32DRAFT_338039 [Colletotrichum zoysiae]|uniref:Uncharacterized protein n=1 Tax=Colletotrichum zoysiae TaxID=1216348 RepID=A0AAD9M232_9PEZI|nr:hypothetical protein LX32DRAFT_338039 [Colletotrichum zoysiae]